jgi:hypothetical protein
MSKRCIFILVSILLFSCVQHETDDLVAPSSDKIYATIDTLGTKVQLNNLLQTVWTKNDVIIVNGPDNYAYYKFDGETGDRTGTFSKCSQDYNYPKPYPFDKYYALYSESGFSGWSYSNSKMYFFMNFPATQKYLPHSYGLEANMMLGVSDDGVNYTFKNLMGYLKLSITGDKVIRSIELSGNNNENLCGQYYFNMNDVYNLYLYQEGSGTLTLDCGEAGVPLSDQPSDFYFVVPPTSFEKGISVNITFTDGSMYPQSTTNPVDILRNTIQPMGAISTSDVVWQTVLIQHSAESFSVPTLIGSSSVSGYVYWGDGNFSMLSQSVKYVYQDSEPLHNVTVKSKNATIFKMSSCEGVSIIDFSKF